MQRGKMNRFLVLVIGLWCFCCSCAAQADSTAELQVRTARALRPQLSWVEPGFLSLSFSCPASLDDLGGDDMLRIMPMLIRPDGKRLPFSPVVYLRPAGKRFLDRRLQFRPDPLLSRARFRVSTDTASGHFLYRDTLAAGASQGGSVVISYYYADCCHDYYLATDTLPVPDTNYIIRQLLPLPVLVNRVPLNASSVAFATPKGEAVKLREQVVRVPLHYRVGLAEVDEAYLDNAFHLARLDSVCRPLFAAPADYNVRSVRVVGYASPEGDYGYNLRLSQRRAQGFAAYLSSHYRLPLSSMEVKGMGEDWDGLRRLVQADSLFAQAAQVTDIIDSYDIFAGRERKLMELQAGDPYRYMLRRFFPQLRRMELELNYQVRAFSTAEAMQKLSTRPQDLDTYEFYQVARQLAPDSLLDTAHGRQDYGKVYDQAAALFPDDVSTRLNAASAALLRYDLRLAYQYLNKLTDCPEAWNNIGIYYWMCGDLKQARHYFEKALEHSPEAQENLNRLNAWEERRP